MVSGRSTWAEGGCTPQKFMVTGDRVLVYVYVVDVYTFRNGMATQFYSFLDERQALEWAGAKG